MTKACKNCGREDCWCEAPDKSGVMFYLRQIRLNKGGYDSIGRYWGVGLPLYVGWPPFDNFGRAKYFRAKDRNAAKAHLRQEFPTARFYR